MESSRHLTVSDGMALNTIGVVTVFNTATLPASLTYKLRYFDGATEVERLITVPASRIGYNAFNNSYEITKSRHVILEEVDRVNVDITFYLSVYAVNLVPIC